MPGSKGAGGPNESQAMSETEKLQMKCHQVTDESLESTRRMLRMVEDSKEAGIRTLVALDEQGEQIDRIDEDMDKIRADMIEAEKALSGMEKCCQCPCACPCFGKTVEYKEEEDEAWNKANEEGAQPIVMAPNGVPIGGGPLVAKITKDSREEEMEENMQAVNSMVGNLRNMAMDMGQEIRAQNSQMKKMTGEADFCKERVAEANKRQAKLLR